jgi:hypothetical protein
MKEEFKSGDHVEVEVRDLYPPDQLFPNDDFWFSGTFIAHQGDYANVRVTQDERWGETMDRPCVLPVVGQLTAGGVP